MRDIARGSLHVAVKHFVFANMKELIHKKRQLVQERTIMTIFHQVGSTNAKDFLHYKKSAVHFVTL